MAQGALVSRLVPGVVLLLGITVLPASGTPSQVLRRSTSAVQPSGATTISHVTPHPARTRTPTPPPCPTSTPTPTLIMHCGHGLCAIITPTAVTTSQAGGSGRGSGASGPSCDFWSIGTWAPCLLGGMLDDLTAALTNLTSTAAQTNIWSSTHPLLTYRNPTVERYWEGMRLLADAFLLLLILGVAGEILLGLRCGQPYTGAIERVWRLVLVAALANGSLALIGQAIDLSNLAVQGLDAVQQADLLRLGQHGPVSATAALLHSLVGLADAVMALLLFLQMVIRLGLLEVLIVLAPLGLLCYAWPRLHGWAEVWSRLFVSTLLTQFIQLAALHLGEDLARDGPALILPGSGAGTTWLGFLLAFAVFVVVLRVPRLLRGHTGTPLALTLVVARAVARRIGR